MFGFTIQYTSNLKAKEKAFFVASSKEDNRAFLFERKIFSKFKEDKVFHENQDFVIGLDGVVLNNKQLQREFNQQNTIDLILHLFRQYKFKFPNYLKGEFCGFVFQKASQELFFFNNKTATKQVFYSAFQDEFIISFDYKAITNFRKKQGRKNCLNEIAVYEMMSFGALLEQKTLIEGIYKLGAGEYLHYKQDSYLQKGIYYDYNNIPIAIFDRDEAIEKIDIAFRNAIQLEYEKDIASKLQHLATLSGGLDSRMNVLYANEMGIESHCFCFSQSGYLDQKIAEKIARELNLSFEFMALDGSFYLKDLKKNVRLNAGLQSYNAIAHYGFALQQLDFKNYGLLHTGQVGDGVLGGLISKEKNFFSKQITNQFLDKISIENQYRDEEIFKLYNRVFNLTNAGSYLVESFQTYLVSPFLDADFMELSFSIDPKLKQNQDIYIDWINKKSKRATQYIWERTGWKPDKKWKTEFSRYTKKIEQVVYKILKKEALLSMTPDEYWYRKSNELQVFYEQYIQENMSVLEKNTNLYNVLKSYYEQGDLNKKSIVLSLLEAIKLFEIEV